MARDIRNFAFIDVNYLANPKWYQVEIAMLDAMPDALPGAVRHAVQDAMHAHLESILYCVRNTTDGTFPLGAIARSTGIDIDQIAGPLFDLELWHDEGRGMARVHDFLDHQPSSTDRQERSEKARKAAEARWGKNAPSNATRNAPRNAQRNAKERRGEERREDNNIGASTGAPAPEFDEFWIAFPSERKRAKADCQKIFTQAVKAGTPAEAIIEAAARYKSDPNREPQFTVNPKTWLREQRWEAGPLPARTGTDRGLAAAQRDMARYADTQPALQVAGDPYPWETTREIGR